MTLLTIDWPKKKGLTSLPHLHMAVRQSSTRFNKYARITYLVLYQYLYCHWVSERTQQQGRVRLSSSKSYVIYRKRDQTICAWILFLPKWQGQAGKIWKDFCHSKNKLSRPKTDDDCKKEYIGMWIFQKAISLKTGKKDPMSTAEWNG